MPCLLEKIITIFLCKDVFPKKMRVSVLICYILTGDSALYSSYLFNGINADSEFSASISKSMLESIGVKFVNRMKALANVIWYLTTFVQKSQKLFLIYLLTWSSLHIWKLYPVNNPKLTEIFTPIHSRLVKITIKKSVKTEKWS